jgi:hypothetical protein
VPAAVCTSEIGAEKSRGQTSLENPDRQLQKQIFADGGILAVKGSFNRQI